MQRNLQLQGALPAQLYIGLGGFGGRIVRRLHKRLDADTSLGPYRKACSAFVVVDTNIEDLTSFHDTPDIHTFHTARQGRANQLASMLRRREPFVEDWLPEEVDPATGQTRKYSPREDVPGAGQIRVESRVGLFVYAEDLRKFIDERLTSILHYSNPYLRRNHDTVDVFVFGSLAGGTSSGCFLPLAYLIREVVRERGWNAKLFGHFALSTVMEDRVDAPLHDYIHGNSYAALMELEHLTAATYAGQPPVPFPWRPSKSGADPRPYVGVRREGDPKGQYESSPPYDWVFLLDEPGKLDLGRDAPDAIADTAYLYLATAARPEQEGERDNYTRFLRSLGGLPPGTPTTGYTKNYGTFGAATLVCPDETLVHYCARLATSRVLAQQLASADGEREVDPKAWAQLEPSTRSDLVNDWWLMAARDQAGKEARDASKADAVLKGRYTQVDVSHTGFWTRIVKRVEGEEATTHDEAPAERGPIRVRVRGQEAPASATPPPRKDRCLLERVAEHLDDLVDLVPSVPPARSFGPSEVARGFGGEFHRLRAAVRNALSAAETVVSSVSDGLAQGELLDRLRKDAIDLDPITERYLLTRLYFQDVPEWLQDAEGEEDGLEPACIVHAPDDRAQAWEDLQQRMVSLDSGSLLGLFDRGNRSAQQAALVTEANQLYVGAVTTAERWLRAHVRRQILQALAGFLKRRMRTYAELADHAGRRADELARNAEELRRSDELHVDDYVLREEVFDPLDATQHRQWDQVFDRWLWERIEDEATDSRAIAEIFSEAFEAAEAASRKHKTDRVDARALLERLQDGVEARTEALVAREIRGDAQAKDASRRLGLDLATALGMEAVFSLGQDYADADPTRPHDLPPAARHHVDQYVQRKLGRLKDLTAQFARLDPTYVSDLTGPDRAFRTAILIGHRAVLERIEDQFGEAWSELLAASRDASEASFQESEASGPHELSNDPRLLILYRASGVVPLWTFRGVHETWDAYETIQSWGSRKPNPLHIDRRWETGLKDLLPQAEAERSERVSELLVDAAVAGLIVADRDDDPDAWSLVLPTVREDLGDAPLFLSYRLDAALRRDPSLEDALVQAVNEVRTKRKARYAVADALEHAVTEARDAGERGPRLEAGWALARRIRE